MKSSVSYLNQGFTLHKTWPQPFKKSGILHKRRKKQCEGRNHPKYVTPYQHVRNKSVTKSVIILDALVLLRTVSIIPSSSKDDIETTSVIC